MLWGFIWAGWVLGSSAGGWELSLDGRTPRAWSALVGAGGGRVGSRCPVASGAGRFAARSRDCWMQLPLVAGSVVGVWQGRGPGSNPLMGSGSGPAGRGVRHVMLCGARGSRGAAGLGGLRAPGIRATVPGRLARGCLWLALGLRGCCTGAFFPSAMPGGSPAGA